MITLSAGAIRGLAVDIRNEIANLQRLEEDIYLVQEEIIGDPSHAHLFYENLAFRLHNFYTGCERIFQMIVDVLNRAPVSGYDWHQRLLERMAAPWSDRPAVLQRDTTQQLREYLGFRHVVRNLYGYELDQERIARLIEHYPHVWQQFRDDMERFLSWLELLSTGLDRSQPDD